MSRNLPVKKQEDEDRRISQPRKSFAKFLFADKEKPQIKPELEDHILAAQYNLQSPEDKLLNTLKKAEISELTFGAKLPFALDLVKIQALNGSGTVDQYKGFVERCSSLHEHIALMISKFYKQELQNMAAHKEDRMNLTHSAFVKIIKESENMAELHGKVARTMKDSLIPSLVSCSDISKEEYSRVLDQENRISDLMKMVRVNLEKTKSRAKKTISEVGNFNNLIEELIEKAKKGDTVKKGGLFSRSNKDKDKTILKASEAAEDYMAQVDAGNEFLRTYATREIPQLLTELQSLEETRISVLKSHFALYADQMESIGNGMLKISNELKDSFYSIDASRDIAGFVRHCLSSKDSNSEKNLEPFQYELEVPLSKIRQAVSLASKERKVLFQASITDIMHQQQKDHPDLQIPLIFIILIKAIELNDGGINSEGIFRISPNHKEIQDTIECFEADLVQFETLNPFLATGVLKRWLRELKEPLISFSLYQSCLALGMQKVQDADQYNYLISQIPVPNQIMLKALINLARKIESNKVITKMNFSNLAIVLGPSILRSPDRTPSILLQNAQFEGSFIEKLFTLADTSGAEIPILEMFIEFEEKKNLEILSPTKSPSKYQSISKGTRPRTQRLKHSRNQTNLNSIFAIPGSENTNSQHPNTESNESSLSAQPEAPQVDDFEMFAPVPYPWIQCFDEQGYIYYYNPETETSQWEYPTMD